jgi:hypothetical protein
MASVGLARVSGVARPPGAEAALILGSADPGNFLNI